MTKEFDEFRVRLVDIQNLRYVLPFFKEHKQEIERFIVAMNRNDPGDPAYQRTFRATNYGVTEALFSAQIALITTEMAHYYERKASLSSVKFDALAKEVEMVCPQFLLKYNCSLPYLHSIKIFIDIRNKIIHREIIPKYKYMKGEKDGPIKVLERNVIIRPYSQFDAFFLRRKSETSKNFLDRVLREFNATFQNMHEMPTGLSSMLFGEFLIEDATRCIIEYEALKTGAPPGTSKRKTLKFYC